MTANKEVRVTFRGIDKTREAFGRIRQNFKKLQDSLGRVKLGFGKLGTIITTAFGAASLKKIIDTGEQIGKLSHKLDISTQSLSELKYAGEKCGIEFDILASSLQEMALRVADSARGTGEAKEALQLLGLSAKELNQLAPNEQIEKIANELSRVTNEADKTQLAIKLFGKEGENLLPLLEKGGDGIRTLREEAKKLGASLSREGCEAMAKFNSELAKLQAVLTSLMTSVLIPILPAITAFFEAVRNGHPAITFIITAVSALLALRLAAWFIGAAMAVKAFTVALIANPLGLVAVAVSTLVAGLVTLTKGFKKGTEAAGEYNKTLEKTKTLSAIVISKQQIADMSRRNELQNEARQIFEQTRTPLEKHNTQMEKLNKLLKQGLINQDTYNRAIKQSWEQLDTTAEKAEDVFDVIKDRSNDASKSLIDNFADSVFVVGGQVKSLKETFGDFFKQMQADILKMTLKQGLAGISGSGSVGVLSGLPGGGSGIGGRSNASSMFAGFAGFFAKGGTAKPGKAHVVGDGGEPELFIPNSAGSIIPFSKLPTGASGENRNIVVNMNIQTPDISSFNHSRSQIIADMARQISRSSRNL